MKFDLLPFDEFADINHLKEGELEDAFKGAPSFDVKLGLPLIDVLVNNKIAVSKREAREFLESGSITVNGEKETDENKIIDIFSFCLM